MTANVGQSLSIYVYTDVSKNRAPKWMVKIMENPIRMDDLGVPLFLETPIHTYVYMYVNGCGDLRARIGLRLVCRFEQSCKNACCGSTFTSDLILGSYESLRV